ncbi:MAG: hypothetical protein MSG64_19735 [Pyrinomonadaceae bacterium MAG19_C2-C3]|nr:hypothetical protein [Pyrinomonadaceae bacterium MAG19_C2-C3]
MNGQFSTTATTRGALVQTPSLLGKECWRIYDECGRHIGTCNEENVARMAELFNFEMRPLPLNEPVSLTTADVEAAFDAWRHR